MAPHPLRRQIRHRHLGCHSRTRPSRSLPAPGHGPGPIQAGLQNLAGLPPHTWRERIEIVAMDGFTGFKSAAAEELPNARAVMDPFHVVHLAGNALDECRRRIQQELATGAGVPPTPCTRPAGCYTPDLACSHHASSTNYSTCFPVRSTSRSRSPGAATRTLSTPTAHPTRTWVRP